MIQEGEEHDMIYLITASVIVITKRKIFPLFL